MLKPLFFLLTSVTSVESLPSSNIQFSDIKEDVLTSQLKSTENQSPGVSIENFSGLFLGQQYKANRLIGSITSHEKLVIDFGELDCFTYLDYVEALRLSNSIHNFIENLIKTRYFSSEISYLSRKHFFSDWISDNKNIVDITPQISKDHKSTVKFINLKDNGKKFISGLNVISRTISYIPGDKIGSSVMKNLKTGDYIGIYTNIKGLDVTHTGIFIRNKNGSFLRHASSRKKDHQVIDSPFREYVSNTPGILVYRPR